MNVALRIGLWFIILLMAYAIGNDVYRFLIK
jgi:membrane-associated protease RseP (regulator of RpoE activity)